MKLKLLIITVFCSILGWGQATLPVSTDALSVSALPSGFSQVGIGTDYTTPCAKALKFDSAADNVTLFFTGTPGTLSYQLKGNVGSGSWQGVFTVEESADGSAWTTLRSITTTGAISTAAAGTIFTDNPLSTTRYIKWTYTTKTNGNVGMCNVDLTGSACTPPADPAGSITVAANPACGSTTLSYSASASDIYWQTTASGTSTANPTTTPLTVTTTGVYYARRYNSATTCWSTNSVASASVTINTNVAIGTQPANRVITDGSNTTFIVTATGTTPTYQWQVDTGSGFVNLVNGAPYSGVTAATLNITAAPITMNGYVYRCVVSGAAPCGSVTSNPGTLTVNYTAPNNPTNITPCYGNNTLGLSWTASSGGSAPDGYMVFALAGATTPAATSAVAGNSSLYTANSDFSLASVVTASLGKCIYKGTGTSFTVTGLTNLSNYSFKVVAYRGTTGTAWSTGINITGSWNTPTTNIVIDMPEVSALAASIASGQSALTWTRPTPLACYDQYLVVANQGAVVFTPSGDGTAYIPNTVYSGSNQVVYNGTGTGVTVTGLTNGTNYCYKVFVRRGTEWSDGVTVCQTPNIVYCDSGATNSVDSEIENVTLVGYSSTISNNTTNACTTGVNNYTAMSADLQVGGSYTVAVEFGDCNDGTQYDGAGGVWIDWNNDGDFLDANETIGTTLVAVSGGNVIQNFTINVPAGQPIGNYIMRIVQTEGGTLGTISPCGTFTYGSTEDYTIQVVISCVPTHTVTTFTPTSGPVGTEVTINGTGLTGATVTFSGVNATILSNTGTQIVAVIPAGATTGMLSVKDAQPCAIDNAFTIISSDKTSCEGIAVTTDLIIYDLHDEYTGDGGFITIYNGTVSTVDMADYSLWRTSNYGDGNEINYATLIGTIASGTLGVIRVNTAGCGPAGTNGTIVAGFNGDDQIQLRNAAGTVVIDDVHAYFDKGYYMVRNSGALSASTTFIASDWSTIPLAAGVCYPSAGLVLPTGGAVPPMVTSQPSYTPSCGSIAATLTTVGAEGYVGGNALAYQWYFAAPGSATWTTVVDGGIYSGATTASLSISTITSVVNYQYYCQIRENLATCYTATNAVKITDSNATTWNGLAWSNGVPTLAKAAIIDGTYVTATNGNFSCCSLTVNVTRTLTISSGGYVEVQNDVTNNGTFTVLNNGSLIQINDLGVNTGNISYERIAMARNLDYVYWSSPVAAFNVNNLPNNYRYIWNTTIANTNGGQGNWVAASGNMVPAKGYIARASNGSATPVATTTTFIGVPNNGVINMPIIRGSLQGIDYAGTNGITITRFSDNWNLVGNPYPSAINVDEFLDLNTNIEGAVRIWTHGNLPSTSINNPFYGSYQANYTPDDYITHNGVGTISGPIGFNGFLAGGQGFMVNMLDGATGSDNLLFNNSLRNKSYNNSQFYRTSGVSNIASVEKNRIWLDLINNSNSAAKRTLIGYVGNATNDKDRLYDAFTSVGTTMHLYSMIANDKMTIQGRKLPFDANDKVDLGYYVPVDGSYSIALATVDGLFSGNQNIFLEDKQLAIIHDLKQNPYSFMSNSGEFNERFVLRYTNETLNNNDFMSNNELLLFSDNSIQIISTKNLISNVKIYNVLGQILLDSHKVSISKFETTKIQKNNVTLLVQITLENGTIETKKIIF